MCEALVEVHSSCPELISDLQSKSHEVKLSVQIQKQARVFSWVNSTSTNKVYSEKVWAPGDVPSPRQKAS